MLSDQSVLVTGGTGSFGTEFIRTVLHRYRGVQRLVVYSRDELKQYEMSQRLPQGEYPNLRFFVGDVRDKDRLFRAMEGIDVVVHAAALKQVPVCEYNPFEAIKTNVLGAQNVIDCALEQGIKKVLALSTDKATAPINLYGATKLCADKLFVAANNYKGARNIRFSVVRYGNVLGSRGSVIPLFLRKRAERELPITDLGMTRFSITVQAAVDFVLTVLDCMWGGEIFVPKIPSYRIADVAEAVAPGCRWKITGIRPGEKLHEELITESDALNCLEFGGYYVVLPSERLWDVGQFCTKYGGTRCSVGFSYNSGTNDDWLNVEQIRQLVHEHVDQGFTVTTPEKSPDADQTASRTLSA